MAGGPFSSSSFSSSHQPFVRDQSRRPSFAYVLTRARPSWPRADDEDDAVDDIDDKTEVAPPSTLLLYIQYYHRTHTHTHTHTIFAILADHPAAPRRNCCVCVTFGVQDHRGLVCPIFLVQFGSNSCTCGCADHGFNPFQALSSSFFLRALSASLPVCLSSVYMCSIDSARTGFVSSSFLIRSAAPPSPQPPSCRRSLEPPPDSHFFYRFELVFDFFFFFDSPACLLFFPLSLVSFSLSPFRPLFLLFHRPD